MNYQVITDTEKLQQFIEWLPELKPDEKYYLCLFARNKYCKELTHIKTDKAQLKRFVSDKERMFHKIRQLEAPLGAYRQREFDVPQEALALYITVNPRNMMKATVNTMVKLAYSIRDQNIMMNPHQEVMSEIQKAKSRTCYVDFDIDSKDGTFAGLHEVIGGSANYKILETRGGFHLLVDPSSVEERFKKTWYQKLASSLHVDQVGDNMIPVPGTFQGGFTPTFK
jgi:hypothetical protein